MFNQYYFRQTLRFSERKTLALVSSWLCFELMLKISWGKMLTCCRILQLKNVPECVACTCISRVHKAYQWCRWYCHLGWKWWIHIHSRNTNLHFFHTFFYLLTQLEVYKPIVNLVCNMVTMGSLYGGDNLMLATEYRKVWLHICLLRCTLIYNSDICSIYLETIQCVKVDSFTLLSWSRLLEIFELISIENLPLCANRRTFFRHIHSWVYSVCHCIVMRTLEFID